MNMLLWGVTRLANGYGYGEGKWFSRISGTNIIFRSSQMDYETGEWKLVEEAANFMVQEDGTLDWQRQPLSESLSILAGVC